MSTVLAMVAAVAVAMVAGLVMFTLARVATALEAGAAQLERVGDELERVAVALEVPINERALARHLEAHRRAVEAERCGPTLEAGEHGHGAGR